MAAFPRLAVAYCSYPFGIKVSHLHRNNQHPLSLQKDDVRPNHIGTLMFTTFISIYLVLLQFTERQQDQATCRPHEKEICLLLEPDA